MLVTFFVCCMLNGQDPATNSEAPTAARWRPILRQVAEDYELVRETDNTVLQLQDRPVYTWARPGEDGGTYGNIFVWTNRGNVESVACFWRAPAGGGKYLLFHELHSLSPSIVKSNRSSPHQWVAKAGVERTLIPDAPAPASNSAGRLQQMREICRGFAAHSISAENERIELRLLPQPLYRYASADPDLLDGALFTFVCTVGTDPEIFLQLEARATESGHRWHWALSRFSHQNLYVTYKSKEIWKAIRDRENPISHNADNTYRLFSEPFDPGLKNREAN
jgi:hypothetical protein